MTTLEVEWDDDTRTSALALAHYQSTLCPLCGMPRAVCQSRDNDGLFDAGLAIRCHAHSSVVEAQRRLDEHTRAPEALMWSPTLRNPRGGDGRG